MKEYEYKCLKCKKCVDVPAGEKPPDCCGAPMIRIFGTQNVIYKGYDFVGPTYHEKRDR